MSDIKNGSEFWLSVIDSDIADRSRDIYLSGILTLIGFMVLLLAISVNAMTNSNNPIPPAITSFIVIILSGFFAAVAFFLWKWKKMDKERKALLFLRVEILSGVLEEVEMQRKYLGLNLKK